MSLTVPQSFTVGITMTSDWHVGSGQEHGEIDSVVQRDADGLPYIPAKTLTGILRDGCEQVALALDEGNERGKWHQWIDVLFGDQPTMLDPETHESDRDRLERHPRPAVLGVGSAYLNADLKAALSTRSLEQALAWAIEQGNADEIERRSQQLALKRQLQAAISFMKPGVAIDAATGSARPDFLRVEEVVRMDAVLEANQCALDFSEATEIDEQGQKVVYALLLVGAQMVERLGGKRRRGNGNCTIEIDAKYKEWLEWLKKHHTDIPNPPKWQPPQPDELTGNSQNPSAEKPESIWYALPLTLTTTSPVVIPKQTVGNVVQSLDYVPGRYLLRYLHKRLGQYLNVSQAIADGDIVVTNAIVAINNQAGRPTPFCLFGEKLSGGLKEGQGVYNRFHDAEPENLQTKGERSGYLGKYDGVQLPDYQTISLELFTHNTIKDEVQRPTSDVGGIYSYQAIPTGTVLKAELRLPQFLKDQLDQAATDWWQRLAEQIRIGQSKKDQYGAINITCDPVRAIEAPQPFNGLLYVWCLSDVLIRNQSLRPTTDPLDFKHALEAALGLQEGSLKERETDGDLLSLMLRSRRTESWQVRWGLPRPSMMGLQAGSCAVYEIQNGQTIPPEKLAEISARGIGDRCVEGYGQLRFNDPLLMDSLVGKTRPKAALALPEITFTPIPRNHPSSDYARLIELAAWREVIANQAISISTDPSEPSARERILGIKIISHGNHQPPESQPSMSQLGGMRSIVGRLLVRESNNPVTRWLDALEAVENRKAKWTDNSLSRIRQLVTDFAVVWDHLGFDPPTMANLTLTANGGAVLREELWAEAVRTLVDAIIRAHKRSLEDAQNAADNQAPAEEAA